MNDIPDTRDFGLEIAALFESDEAGALPQKDLDPYSFAVLTVCTGNICRSPLAQALLRRQFRTLSDAVGAPADFSRVGSSGLGAVVGAPVDPAVLALGTELGVKLASHRARQFEPEHAEAAHLVLTATREQRDRLVELAPGAGSRAFTLAEFARLLAERADDPLFGAPAVPLQRPTRLSRHLQRLVEELNRARQGNEFFGGAPDSDDIEDPYRRSGETHRRVATRIDELCIFIGERLRRAVE